MTEQIRLSFPHNPAYVSSARLTASGIANRINFDIDEIEDIKTAVSEACTYIIRRSAGAKGNFELCLVPSTDSITVEITAEDSGKNQHTNEEMSLMMIKALVDEFTITKGKKQISINMLKKHTKTVFD